MACVARDDGPGLKRLLDSARAFLAAGGEFVYYDTGSKDDSIAIAEQRGCRVVRGGEHSFFLTEEQIGQIGTLVGKGAASLMSVGDRVFNFSEARNTGGRLATNDMVLMVDGCDVMVHLDLARLDELLESPAHPSQISYGQIFGGTELQIARFYHKDRYMWVGVTHEVLHGRDPGCWEFRVPREVLLVNHLKNENKKRHYTAGMALSVLEDPENPRWYHYLGRELFFGRWFEDALRVLGEQVKRAARCWVDELSGTLVLMGQCKEELGDPEAAKLFFFRAFDTCPRWREPLIRLGALYRREVEKAGRDAWFKVIAVTQMALTIRRASAFQEPENNYHHDPHVLLYLAYYYTGDPVAGRRHWELARDAADGETRAQIEAEGRFFG